MHVIYNVERVLPLTFCFQKSFPEFTTQIMRVEPGDKTTEPPAKPWPSVGTR